MKPVRLILLLGAIVTTAACTDFEAERQAAAARAKAQAESVANQGSAQVRQALAAGQAERAYALAKQVAEQFPDTAAGKQLATTLPALAKEAERVAEKRRLDSLWTYHAIDDDEAGGTVYTAYISGEQMDDSAPAAVRLVLRRHPSWGQSVYLLMDSGGDFACAEECRMPEKIDGGEARSIVVSRAKDNVPPALFIENDVEAAGTLLSAREIVLTIAHADGRNIDYRFEVSALDGGRIGPAPKG